MRFNLSIAIVAMVGSNKGHAKNVSNTAACVFNETIKGHEEINGEFDWNEKEQGLILGSFFWGYVLTQASIINIDT
jgi:ACS family sodium-dependent inorganic phosphate cotransporter-like MFS transporter 5